MPFGSEPLSLWASVSPSMNHHFYSQEAGGNESGKASPPTVLALCSCGSCVARTPGFMIPSPSGKWKPFTSPQKHLKSWPKGLLSCLLASVCRGGVGWRQLPLGSAEALGGAGRVAECLTTSMTSSLWGVMCQQWPLACVP